jgi:hypothetical protein
MDTRIDTKAYVEGWVNSCDYVSRVGLRNRIDALRCGSNSHQCGNACVPKHKKCRQSSSLSRSQPSFVDQQVAIAEDKIRNLPYERAVCIDPVTGKEIFNTGGRGDKTSIRLTDEEVKQLKDTILTHNHPNPGFDSDHPAAKGFSFSYADVRAACYNEVTEIRACSAGYNHSLKPGKEGWNKSYYLKKVEPAYLRHDEAVYEEFVDKIIRGKMSQAEADAEFSHEVMVRTSKELGLKYSRTEVKAETKAEVKPEVKAKKSQWWEL